MPKHDRPQLCCVWFHCSPDGECCWRVGSLGITKIEFGEGRGLTGHFDTVMVYRNDKLFAEYPFHNCTGVEYFEGQVDPDAEF